MARFLLTADLHQFIPKWEQLVAATLQERPHFLLIAGDLLPKTTHIEANQPLFRLSGHATNLPTNRLAVAVPS